MEFKKLLFHSFSGYSIGSFMGHAISTKKHENLL